MYWLVGKGSFLSISKTVCNTLKKNATFKVGLLLHVNVFACFKFELLQYELNDRTNYHCVLKQNYSVQK